jgi:tol-pal system protein YbgF
MFLRTLLCGAVALPLLMTGQSLALTAGDAPAAEPRGGLRLSLPSLRLPGAGLSDRSAGVQLAQAGDPRITQLEEQVRQLSGTIEELNFQLLQMQDQLRRMQEDNELRFQEIEQRRSDAGGATGPRPQPTDTANAGQGSGDDDFYTELPRVEDGAQVAGQPPRNFGTITFDQNGNPTGGGVAAPPGGADDTTVAALPSGGSADELYRNAYEFILSGDYSTAEAGFRDLIQQYPQGEHAPDAHFWLGEALLAQQKPREAAEIFLAASRDYPQARKAPDTLFKLGVSLAAMSQRDVACATFAEVGQRYPDISDALKDRIRQEQTLASC